MSRQTPGPSVTSRELALLGTFSEQHRGLSLTQLSQRSGLPLTTTHRLVAELVAGGALQRLNSGQYVIGRRMWDIGMLSPVQSGLRQLASPFLHDIYVATLATVHLAVRDGLETLYVDRLSGRKSVPVVSQIGSRLPLHATGVGKVLLAHAPSDVQGAVLSHLRPVTPHTVTDASQLRHQLARVRREGYAQTSEEMTLRAASIAVPVTALDGNVIAALGVVVPRLDHHRSRLIASLLVASRGIARSIPPSVDPVELISEAHATTD